MANCEHCQQAHPPEMRFCPMNGKLIASALLAPGVVLDGKYKVGQVVGSGGMGAVFEAKHELLGHRVAIKVMLPELSSDEQMSARLVREGRAASATGHPNIAAVTDMGQTEQGAIFVVMEFLAGQTLSELVAETGPLSLDRASHITAEILSGLEAVHRSAIVHRDLKPSNVMILDRDGGDDERERIKIFDFGISKMADDAAKMDLTATGVIMGTPQYMAPEQGRGAADVDHRADIYSAGAIYYKLLTGEPPLSAGTMAELMAKLMRGDISPPSKLRRGLPAAVDQVVLRSLAQEPAQRFPDARSFRRAITGFIEGGRATGEVDIRGAGAATGSSPSAPTTGAHPILGEIDAGSLISLDEIGSAAPSAAAARAEQSADAFDEPALELADTSPPAPADPPSAAGAFGPGTALVDQPLELDTAPLDGAPAPRPPAPRGEAPALAPINTGEISESARQRMSGSARRSDGGRKSLLIGALLLVAGGALVLNWFSEPEPPADPANAPLQAVSIVLKLEPVDAKVYVDNVRQIDSPIRLPKSRRPFKVKVAAEGYHSRIFEIIPSRDQTLTIRLRARQDN